MCLIVFIKLTFIWLNILLPHKKNLARCTLEFELKPSELRSGIVGTKGKEQAQIERMLHLQNCLHAA